jgi:hypothetical protein
LTVLTWSIWTAISSGMAVSVSGLQCALLYRLGGALPIVPF